jgi:hypothetical protein
VDTVELTFGEEERRTAFVHKLTQGTISLAEAHELRNSFRKRKIYANSTRKLFGILCSKISNRLRR